MIFGELPIGVAELVKTLHQQATKIARQLNSLERNTEWTQGVKQALAEMGRTRGFKLFPDSENKRSEFMLDEVWWKDDESGAGAVLGIESEWGNPRDRNCESRAGCVADDFEKLLQFKAPMKLLVFTADNAQMRNAIHAILERYLQRFRQHVAGETYVFVEFSEGRCFSYTCEIQRDGRDPSLALKPLNTESAEVLTAA